MSQKKRKLDTCSNDNKTEEETPSKQIRKTPCCSLCHKPGHKKPKCPLGESSSTMTAASSLKVKNKPRRQQKKFLICNVCGEEGHKATSRKCKGSPDSMDIDSANEKRKCPKCGGTDHMRSTNNLCKNRSFSIFDIYDLAGRPESYYSDSKGGTIKMTLGSFVKDKYLYLEIRKLVNQISVLRYDVSRLLNLFLLQTMEQSEHQPVRIIIKKTGLKKKDDILSQVFDAVQGREILNEELKSVYNTTFQYIRASWSQKMSSGYEQLISGNLLKEIIDDYRTVWYTHTESHYYGLLRKYCNYKFNNYTDKKTHVENCLSFFENCPSQQRIISTYGEDFLDFYYKDRHYLTYIIFKAAKKKIENIEKESKRRYLEELQTEREEIFESEIQKGTEINTILKFPRMKELEICYKRTQERIKGPLSITTLSPLCQMKQAYFTIDSYALTDLLRHIEMKGVGFNKNNLGIARSVDGDYNGHWLWKRFFRVDRYLAPDDPNDILKSKWYFNYRFKTDGFGVSIERQKLTKKKNENDMTVYEKNSKENIQSLPQEEITYIGIDPGVSSVLTTVIQNPIETIDEQEEENETKKNNPYDVKTNNLVCSVSNREYQHLRGLQYDRRWREKNVKRLGIQEWLSSTPSSKVIRSSDFIEYLKHIYQEEPMNKFFSLQMGEENRTRRFKSYKKRQQAIHEVCERILCHSTSKNIVICFGDASWAPGIKGYATSPKGRQFYNYFQRMEHPKGVNVKTVLVPEFNTSQCCSKCLKEERIRKPVQMPCIAKPHFVRKCPTCTTMWNRDVNAARNMIDIVKEIERVGEKRSCFQKKLD